MPDSIQDRLKRQPPYDDDAIPPKEETKEVVEEVKEEIVEETPQEEPKEEVKTEEVVKEVLEDVKKVKKEVEKTEKTKERTKEQFEKLKESNKTLKEERDIAKRKNVLDSLIPEPPAYPETPTTNVIPAQQNFPNLSKDDIKNTFSGLVDDQGYVDTGLLITTLTDLQNRAKEAEERAKQAEIKTEQTARSQADFERKDLMKQVHKKYPKLDPDNEEFDERLWEGVRNEVIGQWTSGHQEDVMAAASKWSDILYGKEEEVKKADKIKAEQAEEAKRNINALGTKQTSQREDNTEVEALHEAARKGKKGAVAELLKRAGQ